MSKVENDWILDKLNTILGSIGTASSSNKGISAPIVTDSIKKRDTITTSSAYASFVDKTVEKKSDIIDSSNWSKMSYYLIIENILMQLNKMSNINEIIRGLTALQKHISASGLTNRKLYQFNTLINDLKSTKEFKIIETRTLLRDIQNELK